MANDMYPTLLVTLADGSEHEAKIENPDMCRLELVGGRNGFSMDDQKITSMTYLAYANLKRNEVYTDKWEKFREHDCVGIDYPDPDEDDDDTDRTISDPKD